MPHIYLDCNTATLPAKEVVWRLRRLTQMTFVSDGTVVVEGETI
jgi:hypothetical protein